MPEHTGSCHCGQVSFRLTSDPMIVHACHCRDCQKQTGGPCAINAIIEADRIERLGSETNPVAVVTSSGRPHDIHRCPTCQSALWSDYGRRGVVVFVRVATLDNPSALPPGVHIYTRSKLPWITIADHTPAYTAFYKAKDVWSAEAIARWEAVTGQPTPFASARR